MYLVTSEQMQAMDHYTMSELCVPGLVLMEHAGKQVADEAAARQPRAVVVLCGKGNNGGDGWVAARWLRHKGVPDVRVISLVSPDALQGDAAAAARMAIAAGVPYVVYSQGDPLPEADVFIDALLGTGVRGELQGSVAELVGRVNQVSRWTVAVDVPTGVDASTGAVAGTAVRADVTIAMAAEKLGTAVSPGCHYAGRVKVADIGVALRPGARCATWVTREWVRDALPPRSDASHKGTYGRIAIAVGEMTGAAVLAGLGAARIGAGLVVLAAENALTHAVPYEFIVRMRGEAPWQPFAGMDSVVVGPGLGAGADRWQAAVREHAGGGVLDADGLALLQTLGPLSERWVLTPHPKECARLLGWTTERVQAERIAAATTLAEQTRAVVVLKGYRSLVAHPDGSLAVNPTGDSSLATAGTGDVLAGVIGGLMAQGLSAHDAAKAGVYLHGLAGELAGRACSKASTMASDVVENISRAIRLFFDIEPEE